MNWWQIILLILTIGLVSLVDIGFLTVCIGKTLDQRIKTKAAIEYRLSKTALDNVTKLINDCFEKYMAAKASNRPGYKNIKPVVPIIKQKDDESFDDIELPPEME